MRLQVNLLHEGELRHQGLVGRRFIIMVSLATLVGVLMLVGVLAGYAYISQRQELKNERAQWAKTEPNYKRFTALQQEQGRIKTVVDEILGWNHARLPMYDLLLELQRMVAPYPIQFTRVTVDSEFTMIQPPAPSGSARIEVKEEGAKEQSQPAAAPAPAKPPPATPARRFHIVITGRVVGEQGHKNVVAFDEQLQKSPKLADIFESVRLQGISRAAGESRHNEQNFTIECLTKIRKYE